ncbi:MAG: MurT ligase domain-containing protein [Syntrophomonadaceae bacterium]|jgi:UDP-N-acetylmuramyl tripeptide synthase|nr:MurT ligase domain-containing protein [Syntrophomonadaceae bacterium]
MKQLRIMAAVLIGKAVLALSRLWGNQGTVLPGYWARKVYPSILKELSAGVKKETVIVTGTNGKTTTANIIAHILRENGETIVHNAAGANMITGITAAFVAASDWKGRSRYDYALLETDEANVPLLLEEISADLLLITNFFRDQLDRFGELDHTIDLIKRAVDGSAIKLILNADDPLVSCFAQESGCEAYYFSYDANAYDQNDSQENREGRYCMVCGAPIKYEFFHYAQLGKYYCPNCGNKNPQADYRASDLLMRPFVQVSVNGNRIQSNLPGYYNAYNILAAAALADHLKITPVIIRQAISSFRSTSGRMESISVGDRECVLTLVKNPAGFNQLLSAFANDGQEKNLVLILNDNPADGRDVSWIWDVEMENIMREDRHIKKIYCAGQRSGDIALRVKYAGWPQDEISIAGDIKQGIEKSLRDNSELIYIVCTYTALFKTRKILMRLKNSGYSPKNRYESPLSEH